ncbi:MAG: TetR family transcriptional regulator [Acidimicrobiia bacterium]|nr:TetR family transcriptional regulator [Acidimicrobiia bacterium]
MTPAARSNLAPSDEGRSTSSRPLTIRQTERRARVLRAAAELAAEGGYDSVQIREVAARAEVALGTVYHYFESKDDLLAALLLEWLRRFETQLSDEPPVGATVADRVSDVFGRGVVSMGANPDVSAALMMGLSSPGEASAAHQAQLHRTLTSALGLAFDDDFDPGQQARIIRTLEHVWYSGLLGWIYGWMPYEQAASELDDAIHVLLDHYS